jgi:hypothetical protein
MINSYKRLIEEGLVRKLLNKFRPKPAEPEGKPNKGDLPHVELWDPPLSREELKKDNTRKMGLLKATVDSDPLRPRRGSK